MDRAVDPGFAAAQRRRRVVIGIAVAAAVLLAFAYGPSFIRPSAPRSRVRSDYFDGVLPDCRAADDLGHPLRTRQAFLSGLLG